MDNIEYPNFSVRTINSNITVDNFYKQDYGVYSVDNEYMFTICRTFVSMYIAKGICSGNEEECIAAIKAYLKSVKCHMDDIAKLLL
jgi:hypothetical protein